MSLMEFEQLDDRVIIRLGGVVDARLYRILRQHILRLVDEGWPTVTLDLTQVLQLHDSVVQPLFRAWASLRQMGKDLQIIEPTANLRQAFKTWRMEHVLLPAPYRSVS